MTPFRCRVCGATAPHLFDCSYRTICARDRSQREAARLRAKRAAAHATTRPPISKRFTARPATTLEVARAAAAGHLPADATAKPQAEIEAAASP